MNEIFALYNDAAIKRGLGSLAHCRITYNIFYAYQRWHIDFQMHFFFSQRTWRVLTGGSSLEEAEDVVKQRARLFEETPKEDVWYDYEWGKDQT